MAAAAFICQIVQGSVYVSQVTSDQFNKNIYLVLKKIRKSTARLISPQGKGLNIAYPKKDPKFPKFNIFI